MDLLDERFDVHVGALAGADGNAGFGYGKCQR
jgi:hypothetical protein